MKNPTATALRSVHEMPESAYKCFEIAPGGQWRRVASNSVLLDPRSPDPARRYKNATSDFTGGDDCIERPD